MNREPIPPLELAFLFAQLSAEGPIEFLSHQTVRGGGLRWFNYDPDADYSEYFEKGNAGWRVYDVRRKQS